MEIQDHLINQEIQQFPPDFEDLITQISITYPQVDHIDIACDLILNFNWQEKYPKFKQKNGHGKRNDKAIQEAKERNIQNLEKQMMKNDQNIMMNNSQNDFENIQDIGQEKSIINNEVYNNIQVADQFIINQYPQLSLYQEDIFLKQEILLILLDKGQQQLEKYLLQMELIQQSTKFNKDYTLQYKNQKTNIKDLTDAVQSFIKENENDESLIFQILKKLHEYAHLGNSNLAMEKIKEITSVYLQEDINLKTLLYNNNFYKIEDEQIEKITQLKQLLYQIFQKRKQKTTLKEKIEKIIGQSNYIRFILYFEGYTDSKSLPVLLINQQKIFMQKVNQNKGLYYCEIFRPQNFQYNIQYSYSFGQNNHQNNLFNRVINLRADDRKYVIFDTPKVIESSYNRETTMNYIIQFYLNNYLNEYFQLQDLIQFYQQFYPFEHLQQDILKNLYVIYELMYQQQNQNYKDLLNLMQNIADNFEWKDQFFYTNNQPVYIHNIQHCQQLAEVLQILKTFFDFKKNAKLQQFLLSVILVIYHDEQKFQILLTISDDMPEIINRNIFNYLGNNFKYTNVAKNYYKDLSELYQCQYIESIKQDKITQLQDKRKLLYQFFSETKEEYIQDIIIQFLIENSYSKNEWNKQRIINNYSISLYWDLARLEQGLSKASKDMIINQLTYILKFKSKQWYQGIKAIEGDYFLILNQNFILRLFQEHRWLISEELIDFISKDPDKEYDVNNMIQIWEKYEKENNQLDKKSEEKFFQNLNQLYSRLIKSKNDFSNYYKEFLTNFNIFQQDDDQFDKQKISDSAQEQKIIQIEEQLKNYYKKLTELLINQIKICGNQNIQSSYLDIDFLLQYCSDSSFILEDEISIIKLVYKSVNLDIKVEDCLQNIKILNDIQAVQKFERDLKMLQDLKQNIDVLEYFNKLTQFGIIKQDREYSYKVNTLYLSFIEKKVFEISVNLYQFFLDNKQYIQKIVNIFEENFNNCLEVFKFIQEQKNFDFRELTDNYNDFQNNTYYISIIQDLIQLLPYIVEILNSSENSDDLIDLSQQFDFYTYQLLNDIKNFEGKLSSIQDNRQKIEIKIFEQVDQSQKTIKLIKQFLKNSKVTFSTRNDDIKFSAVIFNNNNQQTDQGQQTNKDNNQLIEFKSIEEIYQHSVKAKLMITNQQYSVQTQNQNQNEQNSKVHDSVKQFDSILNVLQEINQHLLFLLKMGYYNEQYSKIEIHFNDQKQLNINEVQNQLDQLKNECDEWNSFFNSKMQQYPVLSFIPPRIIYKVQQILMQNKQEQNQLQENSTINQQIQYIQQQILTLIQIEEQNEEKLQIFQQEFEKLRNQNDRYKIIEELLTLIENYLENNQFLLKQQDYEQEDQGKYKIQKIDVKNTEVLENLSRLIEYQSFIPGQFLFCNSETQINDLQLMLYRFQYAIVKNRSYYILNLEKLKTSVRNEFFEKVIQLINEKKRNNLYLFFKDNDNNEIGMQIPQIEQKTIFKQKDLNKSLQKYIQQEQIEIVYSQYSGQGKTFYIEKQIKQLKDEQQIENQYEYLKIPIYGDIKKTMIIQKIQENINKNPKKILIIHFDIYPSTEIDINSFYFEFFAIGVLNNNNKDSLVIPKNCIVFLEIQNKNMNDQNDIQIPLQQLYSNVRIKKLDNQQFVENIDYQVKDKNSAIQLTLRFLKVLDQGSDILDSEDFDKCIEDLQYCQKLIEKFFVQNQDEEDDLKYINYYNLNLFLNVFSYLIKPFSIDGNAILKLKEDDFCDKQEFRLQYIKSIQQFARDSSIQQTKNRNNLRIEGITQNDLNQINYLNSIKVFQDIRKEFLFFKDGYMNIFYNQYNRNEHLYIKQLYEIDKIKMRFMDGSNEFQMLRNLYLLIDSQKYNLFFNPKDVTTFEDNQEYYEKTKKKREQQIQEEYKDNKEQLQIKMRENQELYKYSSYKEWKDDITELQITNENFYKIALIFLRINSNQPVILMGETGIGKTSLVRLLSKIMQSKIQIMNIHAGIHTQEIINYVQQQIKNHQQQQKQSEEPKQKQSEELKQKQSEKLIIFFDEINTNIGVNGIFKELIVDRTVNGEKIPDNITFIAACNPYKLKQKDENKKQKNTLDINNLQGIKLNQYKKTSNLVYLVEIMPYSMYPFIWNYDKLEMIDENNYIQKIIENIPQFKNSRNIQLYLMEPTIQAISQSQQFIRKHYFEYSVSLRELKRFQILFDYFIRNIQDKSQFYREQKNNKTSEQIKYLEHYLDKKSDQEQIRYSIILSLVCCYYLRIDTQVLRNKYEKMIMDLEFTDFKKIMIDEYDDLIYKFKLPPGIAPNISLKENIFALFTCIRTKIPLFILGQPGSSKTLSVNQIISSMRNKISENNYFKTLQEVYPYFYQGHLQSTSDKIEKTFEIAKNFQKKLEKNQNNNNNLKQDEQKNIDAQVMIIIDEIGLAEISPYNPLKVLHPLLEPQSEQDQIAFVGISNWSLDASKMNRGITLQKPKLDLTQLEETAVAIYQDLLGEDKGLSNDEKIKNIFKSVSQLYLDYIQKNNSSNFHGLRDFYFLIKYISKCFKEQINLNQFDEKSVIYKAILKNFGGDQKMLREFIDLYQNRYQTQIQDQQMITKKLIKENLQDNGINDRNLMLISRNIDLALHNLSSIINDNKQNVQEEQEIEEEEKLNSQENLLIGQEQGENQEIKQQKKQEQKNQLKYKKVNYFVGSNFSDDKKVDRSYEIINQVIGCVQNGEICILINLDDIYQSFYDLLNQNFSTYSQGGNLKYFCRVSIGAESSKIQVNEHFKLVLIQDAQTLSRLDPPLLNRFEKHFIDDQISDQEFNQFSDWVQQINVGQKLFTFQDQTVFKSLYQQFKNQNYPLEKIVEACQNEILKLVNLNGLKFLLKEKMALNLNESYVKMLQERLNQKNYNTLNEYLQYHPNNGRKIYSYVYTSNYKQYKHDFEDKLNQFVCKIIDIDNIQQERNLIRQVENYFEYAQQNLLLILYDLQNPNNNKDRFTKIKFILDDQLLKYQQFDHKNIIIIFQLNHKNMYEAITSQQEPCNICKQEQYSIKQCQKLHMNYTGFLYSNNWEQVQIDNLFTNFSQGINEFIEMDLKGTIHQLEELEREKQIELLNDNNSQQNLYEDGLKLSYSSLKAQISEILLTFEIQYDDFNVIIIREFSYFISSEFQQYDKEIAIEFLTWYFEIFMGKQDICQLIIFYNTNKQFMRDYYDLFRLFYQNCQKEDIYNYGKVNIEELENQSFDQKILTKVFRCFYEILIKKDTLKLNVGIFINLVQTLFSTIQTFSFQIDFDKDTFIFYNQYLKLKCLFYYLNDLSKYQELIISYLQDNIGIYFQYIQEFQGIEILYFFKQISKYLEDNTQDIQFIKEQHNQFKFFVISFIDGLLELNMQNQKNLLDIFKEFNSDYSFLHFKHIKTEKKQLQISQIVSEKQILQGLLEQILDQQVENLKNQLEIYQQYGFEKAINVQDFQENEKIFIEILEQCQSQNNNIYDDPLSCLIQDIITELMYKEYYQNKSINEDDESEENQLISQKQQIENFFDYFEFNNGNFKSMLQIFCNKKENQLFSNSLTMNFALAVLKLFLKDIYQAIYFIFEGKQYDETFIKVFQAEYEELNNQKEQEQIDVYNRFIQYIIDMIDEDMNKFREQLNGDLPSIKNSNLRWLDKFIDNDTEDNYYPWANCQQQKPDIKILPQIINIPSSKKKLDQLINFIIDFALNQQLYTGGKYIQNQIENLNLPNETEQNQMLKRMLLSQLQNHQNQKEGNQQKIQQKLCLRKDQKSQLLVNNYTILLIFQVFLLSDTNDSYWKTLALSPEKIFNQNNYIPFMVNDPYIEKIKQTIDDNISTTRGRCKNCRGIVILNNCGNSVFQFQCFKCGIKMGGEDHQNKNYERIDKYSFKKYEIDNIKELNERGNFNQDLKDVPKDKMFRELTSIQFYFGNLMNYTCWIFQLYFSGKSEVKIYQILTDVLDDKCTFQICEENIMQNWDYCYKQIKELLGIKEDIDFLNLFYKYLNNQLDQKYFSLQQKIIDEDYRIQLEAQFSKVFEYSVIEWKQYIKKKEQKENEQQQSQQDFQYVNSFRLQFMILKDNLQNIVWEQLKQESRHQGLKLQLENLKMDTLIKNVNEENCYEQFIQSWNNLADEEDKIQYQCEQITQQRLKLDKQFLVSKFIVLDQKYFDKFPQSQDFNIILKKLIKNYNDKLKQLQDSINLGVNKRLHFLKQNKQKVKMIELKQFQILGDDCDSIDVKEFIDENKFNQLEKSSQIEIFVSLQKLEYDLVEKYLKNKVYIDELENTPHFKFKDNNESLDTMIQSFDICVKQIQEDEIIKQQIKEQISCMTYEDQIDFYYQLIKLLDFLVHIQYAQQQKLIVEIYHKYIKSIKLPQVFNNLTLEYMKLLLECLEEQQMDKLVKNCHAKFCEENKKVNKMLIQAFEKNKNNVKIEELVNFKYQIGRFIIRMLCVIDRIQNPEFCLFQQGLYVYYYDTGFKPLFDLEIEIKYTKQFYDLINQKIDELKNIEKVRLKQNQPNQYVANINEIDQNMDGNNVIQPKQSFYATKNPISKNKKKGLK